jgi:myo-inositol-1(or 4)-monophosphatase
VQPEQEALIRRLRAAAEDIGSMLRAHPALMERTKVPGQWRFDVEADAICRRHMAGLDVLIVSEEDPAPVEPGFPVIVVDPVDGSANAARGLYPYSFAACLVDEQGPVLAYVRELKYGAEYVAVRGGGLSFEPSARPEAAGLLASVAGTLADRGAFAQVRSFGCCSVELALVACGQLDAFVDMSAEGMRPWDYLAGAFLVEHAGGSVIDLFGADLLTVSPRSRRHVVATGNHLDPGVARGLLARNPYVLEKKRRSFEAALAASCASRGQTGGEGDLRCPSAGEGGALRVARVASVAVTGGEALLLERRKGGGLGLPSFECGWPDLPQERVLAGLKAAGLEVAWLAGGPHYVGVWVDKETDQLTVGVAVQVQAGEGRTERPGQGQGPFVVVAVGEAVGRLCEVERSAVEQALGIWREGERARFRASF